LSGFYEVLRVVVVVVVLLLLLLMMMMMISAVCSIDSVCFSRQMISI